MKTVKQNIVLHLASVVLFALIYPLFIAVIGFMFPSQSNGLPVERNGKLIGFENIGQKFTSAGYFQGRPSAVDYNAAATGGSNKGPTNPDYLATVQTRIDEFLTANPDISKRDIPAELVTASGGGLDPHISLKGALIQIPRIAEFRKIDMKRIETLVLTNVEEPLLGFLGPGDLINVLKLNIALDNIK